MGGFERNEYRVTEQHELLGFHATVHPTGEAARLTLRTMEGDINVTISFAEIARAENEMRRAALLMVHRQHAARTGDSFFPELLDSAMRPAATDILIEKATEDRLYVAQFADHAPLVLRMPIEMVRRVQAKESAIMRRRSH